METQVVFTVNEQLPVDNRIRTTSTQLASMLIWTVNGTARFIRAKEKQLANTIAIARRHSPMLIDASTTTCHADSDERQVFQNAIEEDTRRQRNASRPCHSSDRRRRITSR